MSFSTNLLLQNRMFKCCIYRGIYKEVKQWIKKKIKGSAENELDDMVIFRLLDEVIEHGEEALPEMEDYLTDTADSVDSPEVDVEASLKNSKQNTQSFS